MILNSDFYSSVTLLRHCVLFCMQLFVIMCDTFTILFECYTSQTLCPFLYAIVLQIVWYIHTSIPVSTSHFSVTSHAKSRQTLWPFLYAIILHNVWYIHTSISVVTSHFSVTLLISSHVVRNPVHSYICSRYVRCTTSTKNNNNC